MENLNITICGLSKNCFDSLKHNIESIIEINQKNINLNFIIIDSDSDDGSKKYLDEIKAKYNFVKVFHEDNLESYLPTRIHRIAHCRNVALKYAKNINNQDFIYVPMDLDIRQFQLTSPEEFINIISNFKQNQDCYGLFPISIPYYYDIFALRAKGWVNINSQLIVNRIKNIFPIGSFIWNYIFLFRYQWSPERIQNKNFEILSAFGGCGLYKIGQKNKHLISYDISKSNPEFVSEHIFFNENFNNLDVSNNWKIPAPIEHLSYKRLKAKDKINYILKTFYSDFKNSLTLRK